MRIYIDKNYMCHVENDGSMRPFDVPFFDGLCPAAIECFRFVPTGEHWTREDGAVFPGEMAVSAFDYAVVEKIQQQHEADMAASADMADALKILGVSE